MIRLLVCSVLFFAASCDRESPPAAAAQPAETAQPTEVVPAMTRVADPTQVCMVNDQFMGKPQIPIEVDGRTYYGCCPMCKDRLHKEAGTRTARDPVTSEEVDKAKAVMVQDASGKISYFASEDTLRRFAEQRR